MRLSPCRFKVPITNNEGAPVEGQALLDLHVELLGAFGGFTINPASQGLWRSRAGRLYEEEVVEYEVAVEQDKVQILRDAVCRLGRRLAQLAMYFDAPAASVEIIDLSDGKEAPAETEKGGQADERGPGKTTRRRGKKNSPPG